MKLKESQLIILNVSPIYAKTDQSKVANNQISSESYATGKIYLTLKRWLIQPRWFMSNDLALVWLGNSYKLRNKYFSIWWELGKIDKDVQRNFFGFVFISAEMKETSKFLLHKTVKDFKYTYWQKMHHSWQGNVTATGQAVKHTEGKTTKASLPFSAPRWNTLEMLNIQQCRKHFYNSRYCLSVFINLERFMERRENRILALKAWKNAQMSIWLWMRSHPPHRNTQISVKNNIINVRKV